LENVLQLIERLKDESAKGTPIVVEGQNDIVTLRNLGIQGDILSAKSSGKSLLDVIREAEGRQGDEIILLFDFDRRGVELTKRTAQWLERRRIKANRFFWRRLRSMVRKEVKDVEGLATYLDTLRKKAGGQISKV
jgi:2,5-diamino-6-(ribosylamino)-4(3H)-pyrimidinone 5'-phosphate reductase